MLEGEGAYELSFRYVDIRNVGPALKLKELLGPENVAFLRSGEHPLADGLKALDRRLTGRQELSRPERQALTNLVLDANMLFALEHQWVSHRNLLVKNLLTVSEYVAIAFELEVMSFALDGVAQDMRWERYAAGRNDIRLVAPDVVVECACFRASDLEGFFDKAIDKAGQRRQLGLPYVVALGFAQTLTVEEARAVEELVRRRIARLGGDWRARLERHKELSALLVFLPAVVTQESVVRMHRRMTPIRLGQIVEIRSNVCSDPLPGGFAFRFGRTLRFAQGDRTTVGGRS